LNASWSTRNQSELRRASVSMIERIKASVMCFTYALRNSPAPYETFPKCGETLTYSPLRRTSHFSFEMYIAFACHRTHNHRLRWHITVSQFPIHLLISNLVNNVVCSQLRCKIFHCFLCIVSRWIFTNANGVPGSSLHRNLFNK
jgi:hypothetical protein